MPSYFYNLGLLPKKCWNLNLTLKIISAENKPKKLKNSDLLLEIKKLDLLNLSISMKKPKIFKKWLKKFQPKNYKILISLLPLQPKKQFKEFCMNLKLNKEIKNIPLKFMLFLGKNKPS